MTNQTAVLYNGHVARGNRGTRSNAVAMPSVRHYPAADAGTAKLVNKLRSRSSKTFYAISRQNSSDLMKMAYMMPAFYQSTPVVSSVSVNINENRNNMVRTAPVHTAAKVGTGTRYSASISAQAKTRGAEVRRQPYTAAVTSSNRVINKPVNGRVNAPVNQHLHPLPSSQQKQLRSSSVSKNSGYPASRANSVSGQRRTHNGRKAYAKAHGNYHAVIAKKPMPLMSLSLIVLCAALLMMIIYSAMQNYQYKNEIAELQSKLTSLKAEAEDLRLSLEARDDLAEIEKRAVEIGMVKTGQVEQRHIDIGAPDAVENLKTEGNEPATLATMFSAFGRTLSRFFSRK